MQHRQVKSLQNKLNPSKKGGKKVNLTVVDGAVIVISAVIAILSAALLGDQIKKRTKWGAMTKTLAQVGTAASVLIIGVAFFAPSIASAVGLITPAAEAPPVGPVVEQIQAAKQGYVLASVKNAYQMPTTLLADATVYVSLTQPVANNSWIAVAQDNTASTGSVLVTVQGVTSGTVYVTAYKSGYYSDFVATTIPGAQEMPTAALIANVPLVQTGSLLVTQYDNSSASYSAGTITVDNDAESAYITLDFTCENVWMALKDLRMLGIRGTYWTTNAVVMAPVIISDADLTAVTISDPTMTNSTTGGYDLPGNLTFGKTLRIRFTISKTASVTGQELFRVSLDDLTGLKGYVGETGISETVLTFTT